MSFFKYYQDDIYQNKLKKVAITFHNMDISLFCSQSYFCFNELRTMTWLDSNVSGPTQQVQQVQQTMYQIYTKFCWVRRDLYTLSVKRRISSGFQGIFFVSTRCHHKEAIYDVEEWVWKANIYIMISKLYIICFSVEE